LFSQSRLLGKKWNIEEFSMNNAGKRFRSLVAICQSEGNRSEGEIAVSKGGIVISGQDAERAEEGRLRLRLRLRSVRKRKKFASF